LEGHAEVNKQDVGFEIQWDNCSPLHFAAEKGFVSGAQAMIEYGAAINIQSRKKETPLVIAVMHNQLEMTKFLISSHADVQKTALGHRNPLFFANVGPIADVLVEAGTALNHRDDDGNTPLHIAAERGLVEVAEVLIKREAQLNAVDEQVLPFVRRSIGVFSNPSPQGSG
jgi:ankyrin repeat protein